MRKGLFRSMALMNIRRNRKFYLPFLLTVILVVAMFYNMYSVSVNPSFTQEGATVAEVLGFGVWVIGIFSVIFIFYTNSFLLRRRKQELGLYHILGLEKRHIAKILAWETLFLFAAGICGGLLAGLLLDRLMFLVVLRIFHYPVQVSYHIYPYVAWKTAAFFAVIFALIYLSDVRSLRRSSAIELLSSRHAGEREPKVRWVLTLLGVACIAAGYYMAVTVDNVPAALTYLFIAVLLVMAGTYSLFLTGSIAVLKLLKKRKKYYYKTNHFVAVSGLIYRMKQNAVGLANICILSTGVLLVVSTTVCMYGGMQSILNSRFPQEISLSLENTSAGEREEIEQTVWEAARETGCELEDYQAYESLNVSFLLEDGELKTDIENRQYISYDDVASITFLTADMYEELTGERLRLQKNEVAAYHTEGKLPDTFQMLGEEYTIRTRLDDFPVSNIMANVLPSWFDFVVDSEETMQKICRQQGKIYEVESPMKFDISFNVSGDEQDALHVSSALRGKLEGRGERKLSYLGCRYQFRDDAYVLYGSMLFLGIYLGALFLTATVLIIYYKQIIEGYEDRERFVIMRKVGMDDREVRRAIRSQILILFFLPLATALVHCLAAFHLMTKIMQAFYMSNVWLFAGVTAVVACIFTLGYVLVFAVTSRSYYHIVSETAC